MTTTNLPPGSNAERSRLYNRGMVLGHLRREGEAGRAEIARASGLSTQAVSNIIAELLDDGWVSEVGRRAGQRGLPAVTYAIKTGARTALGVEIRPDAVLAGWIDLGGRVLHTERVALRHADRASVLPVLEALRARGEAAGVVPATLIGAGVVMPGPIGQTGLSGLATELPGWGDGDHRAALETALELPVTLENDANAAAMAERILGAASGLNTFVSLYFGTGLGLGVVINGSVYGGAFGNSGEIGQIPLAGPDGPVVLEDRASRMALASVLAAEGVAAQTVEDLAVQFEQRPRVMTDWLAAAAEALGQAAVILENLFDPEAIVLTGAMPQPLLEDLVVRITLPERSVANRADRRNPRLIAGTTGRMAATLGAAALVVNSALSPRLVATP